MQAPNSGHPGGVSAPPDRLPRGPHGLTREEIAATQRQRMLSAALELLADKGLATTVADITAHARVSRKTFYEHFADREDCLLAVYDSCNDALLHHLLATDDATADPIDRLRATVHAYLDFLAASPTLARAALVEGPTTGPRAIQHCAESRRALATLVRTWHESARSARPDYPEVPATTYTALAGAMHELTFQHVIAGHAAQLRDLEPALINVCQTLLSLPTTKSPNAPT